MLSASARRRHEKNREAVRAWKHPPGTPVVVQRHNGTMLETETISGAFLLDGRHAMVRVAGIPGNTRLQRVTAKGAR